MTKVQQIWQFINFNSPTRTELNLFILGITLEDYDNIRQSGHYGTNIREWKSNKKRFCNSRSTKRINIS